MNIEDKKTVLDDSASIYQRREEKSERTKWKELKGFRAKWEHFKAYYLLKTFIFCCVVAVLIYAGYALFGPKKDRVLYAAILDGVVLEQEMTEIQAGFEEYYGLDPETQETYFTNSLMISSNDSTSRQVFATHVYAGEIDIIIGPESVVKDMAGVYYLPLAEQLPADLYAELSERFCYASKKNAEGNAEGVEQPYGLYVTDLIEVSPYCREELMLVISGTSGNEKNAEEFIRYLLERGNSGDEKE